MYSAISFTMVFSNAKVNLICNITVHGKYIEQVQSFVYLGSIFSSDAICKKDIRRRIGIAKFTFTSLHKVLISRSIDITVRMLVLKCNIWSTLLYGCKT